MYGNCEEMMHHTSVWRALKAQVMEYLKVQNIHVFHSLGAAMPKACFSVAESWEQLACSVYFLQSI